ncbi:MAG: hypothetical protein IJG84_08215 [Kiritimatiellae bacterium]|nr:hypothetical protein [Kiritimatiellia bacterium]
MTTDKNNLLFLSRTTVRGYKSAARLRGEKEDVVFTRCSGCFLLEKEAGL